MQPPMLYTGQKPVDPLILNVWPLAPGTTSSYSVYEDSGVAEEYQRGVFARTPIKATQWSGRRSDLLSVEIGPVQGSYPGALKMRGFELRLPADWPPEVVTVNGKVIPQGGIDKPAWGWRFEGNTLTTVIPVPSASVAAKVTIEVLRAKGLTARRDELDGFAGTMTRLRGAYDAMHQTEPVSDPPDILVEAMQTGDRLSYYPEHCVAEVAHLREVLPKAQAAVAQIGTTFSQRVEDNLKRYSPTRWLPGGVDINSLKQERLDAMARAERLITEAAK
jgi:alpha-glucosidase